MNFTELTQYAFMNVFRYMFDRRVPYRMMDVLGQIKEKIKIVAIIRNPVFRAYSGFFQSDDEVTSKDFADLVKSEIEAIRKCYVPGLIFVNDKICHTPKVHYSALKTCIAHEVNDGRPWFERFIVPLESSFRGEINKEGYSYWQHEGVLLRGIYIDQLKTFLCAGWKPEQIFITTTSELHLRPLNMLKDLAAFLKIPFALQNNFQKRLESGSGIHRGTAAGHHDPMPSDIQKTLQAFFDDFNLELVNFLRQHKFICNVTQIEQELRLLV